VPNNIAISAEDRATPEATQIAMSVFIVPESG